MKDLKKSSRREKQEVICNRDCFHCPFEDCQCEDLTLDDYRAERELDLLSGAKELKTSSAQRAYRRAYYAENKEKVAAYNRAYYAENKEKVVAYNRAYYAENKEQKAAYNRAYYAENKEKIAAYNRAYYAENKEKWKSCRKNKGGTKNGNRDQAE